MTRTEKIRKLANAVKDYRGSYSERDGHWIRPPQINAIARVRTWLKRLRLPDQESIEKINRFRSLAEFHEWLKEL